MTEWERGYLAGLRFAAEACRRRAETALDVRVALLDVRETIADEADRVLTAIEARCQNAAAEAVLGDVPIASVQH